jgi:hypothetical protein
MLSIRERLFYYAVRGHTQVCVTNIIVDLDTKTTTVDKTSPPSDHLGGAKFVEVKTNSLCRRGHRPTISYATHELFHAGQQFRHGSHIIWSHNSLCNKYYLISLNLRKDFETKHFNK